MKIEGVVNRSSPSEKTDSNGKPYHNLSVEGFSLIPGKGLESLPVEGQTISGTVQVFWRSGKAPLHFLTYWTAA